MAGGGLTQHLGRGFLARAALPALVIAVWAAGAGPARAAETTVSLEGLQVGTVLTNQVQAQGIELGPAKQFGQASPPGDCGAPTIEEQAEFLPPKYAELAQCFNPMLSGTFGTLTKHPRGTVSLRVRDLTVGVPNGPQVTLTTYDAQGNVLATAQVTSSSTVWESLSAAQSGGNNAQVSYFSVVTVPTSNRIAIDDITFEASPQEAPTTTTPQPPTPPAASVGLQTPNPAPGGLLGITGAGSQPGSGRIISYDWDLNGDGKIDTSTGTNPIVHLVPAPGPRSIGLTVTNSGGEKSSSKFQLTVPNVNPVIAPHDGGEGPCEPTLQVGDAQIVAECIQKLPGGGYAIATKQLGLNGMVMKPRGGGFGVFTIHTVKDFAIDGTKTVMSGSPVDVELLNTPIGDVVLGGRDLEGEPIQLDAQSGLNHLKVPVLNHGLHGPQAHTADAPTKTLLMAIGTGRACTGKEKSADCCPPAHENTACATLPGNFPLVGQVIVYLNNKGQALFDVQVGLALKGVFEATGALEIEADPSGVNLNSLVFTIPEAGLEGIFTVKKAKFAYYFPSAPEESKRDTWQAEGEIVFGPLGEPALEAELAFKKGQFHSGSLVFVAPPPGIPIYPGIFLNKLGGSIGVEPFAFGGTLGAKVAETLELTLSFKFREASGDELGFFGGQGVLELGEDKIATLAADVYSDGYVDAQLQIALNIPFTSDKPIVKVGGNIGFWDEPTSGLWQAEGNVYLKLWEISAEVAGLVNNQYIAGCLGAGGFGVQGRYRFSDGNIGGGVFGFSNCSDQLKQYQQQPLVKHSGGFVGGESLRFPTVRADQRPPGAERLGAGAVLGATGSAAAVEGDTFTLRSGQFAQALRISSSSGTPQVTLIAPGGQTYTTPVAPGHIVTSANRFIAVVAPNHDQVLVMLKHPQGGRWRMQTVPGSPPISKLEVAHDTPPARVRVKVSHGHGRSWSLAYRIGNYVPGTSVRLVERGRDSTHVLGIAKRAAGTLHFVPEDALSRSRRIVAYLLNTEGAPQRVLTVGHYTAPGARRGGRVRGVRIVRRGLTALVTWRAATGTRLYRIQVRGSDGRLLTLLRKPSSRSVLLTNVLPFEAFTATVSAEGGPNLLRGPAATARLAAAKAKTVASAKKRKAGKRKH
jgi:PKD repeat protein